MQAIAELRGWTQFCALQIAYSLIERTVEREMIPMAHEMGMGVSPWAPLGQGMLTGKYTREDLIGAGSMDDISSRKAINAVTGKLTERNLDIADVVVAVAKEIGCTAAQLALAWTLRNPDVVSPVIGVRTPAQLEDNLGALDVEIFGRADGPARRSQQGRAGLPDRRAQEPGGIDDVRLRQRRERK